MRTTYAVLGAGGWGTAVAIHLAKRPEHTVRLWAHTKSSADALRAHRENLRQLPGVTIPETIAIHDDPVEATRDADTWIIAIPTAYLRATLAPFTALAKPNLRAVSLTKGIEADTFLRPTEILSELLPGCTTAVLSGPSHAEEMARGMPTSVVVASRDAEFAVDTQRAFGTDRFRVYTNLDVKGVEIAAALKNVIGIAAGLGDGLGFGDNAKSALLTRGIVEMTRFGVALGADPATFAGLAGIGDLITTCFSKHGRNRRVGERIAKGDTLAQILSGPQVAEGVTTARSIEQRRLQMGLDLPIMSGVYAVLYEKKSPLLAVQDLMSRQMRGEDAFDSAVKSAHSLR